MAVGDRAGGQRDEPDHGAGRGGLGDARRRRGQRRGRRHVGGPARWTELRERFRTVPGELARLPDGRARDALAQARRAPRFFLEETTEHYEEHRADLEAILAGGPRVTLRELLEGVADGRRDVEAIPRADGDDDVVERRPTVRRARSATDRRRVRARSVPSRRQRAGRRTSPCRARRRLGPCSARRRSTTTPRIEPAPGSTSAHRRLTRG